MVARNNVRHWVRSMRATFVMSVFGCARQVIAGYMIFCPVKSLDRVPLLVQLIEEVNGEDQRF